MKTAKIAESNSTTCKWIFHQLAAKNLNVSVVQPSTASIIRYSIGKKKSYIIHLFDRPKSGFVRAKKYLAGNLDRRPAVRYFEPCKFFFLKNDSRISFFPDIVSIFQTFSRSGKLLGKFQLFLKNSRLCTNPVRSNSTPMKLYLKSLYGGGVSRTACDFPGF